MHTQGSSSTSLITKVNVTPIIDVALVLVIILLVTAPIITVSELPVRLPEAHSRGVEDERNVSITLSMDGELAIDQETIAANEFRRKLREKLSQPDNADVLVVVRADADAQYTQVGTILEEARRAGATRLAIATRQGARHRVRAPRDVYEDLHAPPMEDGAPPVEGGR